MKDERGNARKVPSEPNGWQCFITALQFLTRIPVSLPAGRSTEYYATAFQRSLVFLPVVGGLVGLFTAAVFAGLMTLGLTPIVAAFIAVGLEAFLTGAFHEDAFADTWDALGGGWTRAQIFEIMKDSRLGTYGTLALIIGIGIRVTTMAAMGERDRWWTIAAIVAAASVARVAILAIMATTSPAPDRVAKSNELSGRQPLKNVWIGAIFSSPFWIAWVVLDFRLSIVSIFIAIVVFVWFRSLIIRRVGGTTGDLLGCNAYTSQLLILIGASVR